MNFADIKKYFLNIFGTIIISLFIIFIFTLSSVFENIDYFFTNKDIGIIFRFIISFIVIFILSKIYNEDILKNSFKKLSIKSFFEYEKKYVLLTFSLLIISFFFCLVSHLTIYKIFNIPVSNTEHDIGYWIGAFIYTPFIEELVFRGLFFNIAISLLDMENNVVKYISVIANISIFLVAHYTSFGFNDFNIFLSLIITIVPRLAISISFTYLYIKTKDIKYNIILHMIYNFTLIFTSFISNL